MQAKPGAEIGGPDRPGGDPASARGIAGSEAPAPGSRAPTVARVARELEAWGWERRWRGRDPFDALNGSRARAIAPTPLARRVVIQLAKRSPVDLSRPLGVPRGENANTIAHVLRAYARMDPALGIDGAARAEWAIDRLEALRNPSFEEPCWGYHFDVETRFFFYAATTPNTIATAFAGLALLDADERLGSARALVLAEGVGEFFLRRIDRTPGPGGAYLGYYPGDRTPIHNASMLGASVLARLAARTGRDDFAAAASEAVGYALAHQRPDGSWPYAEGEAGDWVDNFHTGYVLDALLRCADSLDHEEARAGWLRGLRYFRERLFDPDGAPRFTDRSRYPIDGQCVAQSIETFALGTRVQPELLADARRVLDFGLERMRRRDGAFYFQRHRRFTNAAPHVRWVQAPMLSALVRLDEAERDAASVTDAAGEASVTDAAGEASVTDAAGEASVTDAAGEASVTGAAGEPSARGAAGEPSAADAGGEAPEAEANTGATGAADVGGAAGNAGSAGEAEGGEAKADETNAGEANADASTGGNS